MKQYSIRFFPAALGWAILGSVVLQTPAATPLEPQEVPELLRKLVPLSSAAGRSLVQTSPLEAPRISMNSKGFLRSIGAPPGHHFPPEVGITAQPPEVTARNFMRSQGRLFGVGSTNANYIT